MSARLTRLAIAAVAGLLAWTSARAVLACGATPMAWWTFKAPIPPHGTANVAVDAAIVLPMQWFSDDRHPTVRDAQEIWASTILGPRRLSFEFTDQANQPIAGAWRPFGGVEAPAMVFRPLRPLAAYTAHRVIATLFNEAAGRVPPATAAGETRVEVVFTTGAASLPPLASGGTMRLALETHLITEQDCGCGCFPGWKPYKVRRARVTLPPVTGGDEAGGYQVRLELDRKADAGAGSSSAPSSPGGAALAPGAEKETFAYFHGSQEGDHCLTAVVEDTSGKSLVLPPSCFFLPPLPLEPAPADAGRAPLPMSTGTAQACSFARSSLAGVPVLAGAFALAFLWFRRRR